MAKAKNTEARALIASLKAGGLTQAQISKAVGRDSSLISQAARGIKPVENLLPALRSLAEKKAPTEPERRRTKSGAEAKVRLPKWREQVDGFVDKKGRLLNGDLSGMDEKAIAAMLRAIAKDGGQVSFTAQAHDYKKYRQLSPGIVPVTIFEDGENAPGIKLGGESLESYLIEVLLDAYDVESVGYLTDLQINVVY